jgi:hypothetical protein
LPVFRSRGANRKPVQVARCLPESFRERSRRSY